MTPNHKFELRLKEFISNHQLFDQSDKLLVAFSGGLDSTTLLLALNKLGFNVSAAHCNFKLRGEESDTDEAFCENFCQTLEIEYNSIQFDTQNISSRSNESIQQNARRLRYEWFQKLCIKKGYIRILTAHHLDDQIETMLINLLRGSGLSGLAGIPVKRDQIVRPFLKFSKNEIEEYARSSGLTWKEDSSNSESKYLRNSIRINLVPILEKINPSYRETISRTGTHLMEANRVLQDYLADITKDICSSRPDGCFHLKLDQIKNSLAPISVLHSILTPFGFSESQLRNILIADSGRRFNSDSHEFWVSSAKGGILRPVKPVTVIYQTWNIEKESGTIKIGNTKLHYTKSAIREISKDLFIINLDLEKVSGPLTIRTVKEGDWMCPLGMKGKRQKLQDIFVNAKLSPFQKQNQLIITDNKGQIICLPGLKMDDRFKVDEGTTNMLTIEVKD